VGETLGFGDMYANKGSIGGDVILAVQVILGYVLLGALVTRFAVLFPAGGQGGVGVLGGKLMEKGGKFGIFLIKTGRNGR